MQIRIGWTCRECELDQELVTDSSNHGALMDVDRPGLAHELAGQVGRVPRSLLLALGCKSCGHVSGELGLGYRFRREEHAPSWER
jgi:hypothetical protein